MTAAVNTGRAAVTSPGRKTYAGRRRRSVRVSKNIFTLIAALMITVFVLVGLSAYAASIQHENNMLTQQNDNLRAEIYSLSSQIVDETKVTRIEQIATGKYGMVYPTSDNCIYISEDTESTDNLAAAIRSEAYN